MAQVVAEIQSNLRTIEQALDAFFRDPAMRAELAGLDKPVRQVLGALTMLNEDRAAAALAACGQDIQRFAAEGYAPEQDDFERVAGTLVRPRLLRRCAPARPRRFRRGDEAASRRAAMPRRASRRPPPRRSRAPCPSRRSSRRSRRNCPRCTTAWKSIPTTACSRRPSRRVSPRSRRTQASSPTRVSRARPAKRWPFSPPAACCRSIRRWCGRSRPSLPRWSPRRRPRQRLPSSSRRAPRPSTPNSSRSISRKPAKCSATISASLVEAREAPQNVETLRTIRRGFHTLKGSGRMVGLTRLGEAAWAVEQVMNKWLEEERAGTPDLFTLIVAAQDFFGIAVEALKAEQPSPDEAAIVALANKVKTGEPLGEPAAPAAVAVAEAPAIESIEIDIPVERRRRPSRRCRRSNFRRSTAPNAKRRSSPEARPQRRQSRCRRSNRPSSRCARGRARIRARAEPSPTQTHHRDDRRADRDRARRTGRLAPLLDDFELPEIAVVREPAPGRRGRPPRRCSISTCPTSPRPPAAAPEPATG